ncbi:MAG: alpha/beta hydrolase [Verrucomicrobiota bacterium]
MFKPLKVLCLASLVLSDSSFAQRSYPPEIPDAKRVTYKEVGDVKLDLWIFQPDGWTAADRRPAVIFFFGGGWKSGSPAQFTEQCKKLAARGMVAMTADYRVRGRHQTLANVCVEDARDAMRWARNHAGELGIDPDRLAAGGGSAGGHVAACLGVIAPEGEESVSSRADALVLFNPACVLAPIDGLNPSGKDRSAEMRERMGVNPVALSPAHHIDESDPPAALFHGTQDPTVLFVTAEIFTRKMKEAGVRCELFAYEGEKHGFFNFGRGGNEMFEATTRDMEAFLTSLGWLE